MQINKKTDLSLDSLTSDFTSSPPSPLLDSPLTQEDSKEVFPANGEVVPFIPQETSDEPQRKRRLSRGGKLILLSLLGIGGLVILVSLPSFLSSLLSCGSSAKQSEAKYTIGTINRAQQAYFLEYQEFTTDLAQLGVGIKTETVNYRYSIQATKNAAFNYAVSHPGAYMSRSECFGIFCWDVKKPLKSYVGAVFAVPATNLDPKADKKEMTTVAIACEALHTGAIKPAAPTIKKGVPTCGFDTRDLSSPLRKD